MTDPCGDGNALDRDSIRVNFLAVILNNSFARCYHWGNALYCFRIFCIISSNCI